MKNHQLKQKYSSIKAVPDSTPTDLHDIAKDETRVNRLKNNLAILLKESIIIKFCEWAKEKNSKLFSSSF